MQRTYWQLSYVNKLTIDANMLLCTHFIRRNDIIHLLNVLSFRLFIYVDPHENTPRGSVMNIFFFKALDKSMIKWAQLNYLLCVTSYLITAHVISCISLFIYRPLVIRTLKHVTEHIYSILNIHPPTTCTHFIPSACVILLNLPQTVWRQYSFCTTLTHLHVLWNCSVVNSFAPCYCTRLPIRHGSINLKR